MSRLTEAMALARGKRSELGQIKQLNCWGCDLSDVSIIKQLTGVEVLALPVNKISTLSPFEECHKLRELYLRQNNISDIREVAHLKNLPVLRCLSLAENPLCERTVNYRSAVLRALPNLEQLDNVTVTPEEVEAALRGGGGAVIQEVYEDAYQQQVQEQQPQEQQPQRTLTRDSMTLPSTMTRRGRPARMSRNLLSATLCLVMELDYASLQELNCAMQIRMNALALAHHIN